MSVCIDEVLDYLDKKLVCQRTDSMPALLEVLHDAYIDYGGSREEVTAFSQGVLAGMMLMTEVDRLP